MKITVLIPALNEAAHLEAAVRSCTDAKAEQIVVVDGGSRDGTPQLAVALGCDVVIASPGRGVQLRQAMHAVRGDLVVVLHADNQLTTPCLEQIRAAARQVPRNRYWGGFQQHIQAPGLRFRWLEKGNALRARWIGWVYGDQTPFFSTELLQQVGGIPPLPLMEDLELSRRCRRLASPRLLPGPTFVSARRWLRDGVLKRTCFNWRLVIRYLRGTPPESLLSDYRPHQ